VADSGKERALDAVADRTPVDWDALEREAGTEVDRDWIRWVRVLEGVAGLHQADPGEASREDGSQTLPPDDKALTDEGSTSWGKYVLVQKVGEGGFGSVYRAWDPDLQLEVAIKILHRRIADDRLKQALLREGRALARIKHENVVRVLGVESHDDQIALRMEFVHGETLEQVLRRHGTLNAREAALVGADVCRALAAVHLEGFVHRDVKARNVMREKAGRIVLMDFGAGRQAEDLKIPGKILNVGTPLYMAPEVMAGEPATPASDVYGVGVLLYYLVTGKYPVEGETPEEIRLAHMAGRRRSMTDRRPNISTDFAQVVERALAPDVTRRYATAGALLEALATIFGTLKEPHTRTAKDRARTVAAVIAATAMAAIVVTGFGAAMSVQFNNLLGRSEFSDEGLLDVFVWGLRSCLGPAAVLLQNIVILALLAVLRRLAVSLFPAAAAFETRTLERIKARAKSLGVDDAQVLASLLLLLSMASLVGAWWYFTPIYDTLSAHISTEPAGRLAVLSPDFFDYRSLYRKTFIGVSNFTVLAWYVVNRVWTPKRSPLDWAVTLGAGAIVLLSLTSLELPYRTFLHNDFETAQWHGQSCYALGERGDEMLISCPALPPPRNRVVSRSDPDFKLSGVRESIFARFQELQTPSAGIKP